MSIDLREALERIAKRKTSGPHKPGQIKAEHRAMIAEARQVLASIPVNKDEERCSTCGQTNAAFVCSDGFHAPLNSDQPVTGDGVEDVARVITQLRRGVMCMDAQDGSDRWEADHERTSELMDEAADMLAALSAAKPVPDGMVLVSRDDLERIRRSMCLLQQNSEGCAQSHYGGDFEHHGMPGWLVDTKRDALALTALLASKDTRP